MHTWRLSYTNYVLSLQARNSWRTVPKKRSRAIPMSKLRDVDIRCPIGHNLTRSVHIKTHALQSFARETRFWTFGTRENYVRTHGVIQARSRPFVTPLFENFRESQYRYRYYRRCIDSRSADARRHSHLFVQLFSSRTRDSHLWFAVFLSDIWIIERMTHGEFFKSRKLW